jgi:hypothetical protein
MVKIGLSRTDFTCRLVHDTATLKFYEETNPDDEADIDKFWPRSYVDQDSKCLGKILCNRDPQWISGIKNGSINRIMVSDIGVYDPPHALFNVKGSEDFYDVYFQSITANVPWGQWGGMDDWPYIIFEL